MTDRPNVLLVVLDSTRARNTSLHGYERETTPFLDSFGERATVYTQARAPSIHSIASHVSMFTGLHVPQHEAYTHTAQVDSSQSVWPELHAEFGYATGLFTNNRIVSDASNLGTHFESQYTPAYSLAKRLENTLGNPVVERTYFRLADLSARLADRLPDLPTFGGESAGADGDEDDDGNFKTRFGGEYVDGFLDWESGQDGPWAACLNLMDTHSPYHPNAEYDRWGDESTWAIQRDGKPSVRDALAGEGWDRLATLEDLYDGTIRQADDVVRDLVSALERRDRLSETLLVVTSDHGEAFGERSRVDPSVRLRGHKWGIHEVLTHVPLVVSYPGQTEGRVVDDVVSLTDLPALFRAVASGVDDPGPALLSDGPALASTFRLPERKTVKYSSVDGVDRYVGPWRAVYEDDDGTVRKFARHGDDAVTVAVDAPGEGTVLERSDDGRVADVYDRLDERGVVTQQSTEIDDELEEKLEQLGYIR